MSVLSLDTKFHTYTHVNRFSFWGCSKKKSEENVLTNQGPFHINTIKNQAIFITVQLQSWHGNIAKYKI